MRMHLHTVSVQYIFWLAVVAKNTFLESFRGLHNEMNWSFMASMLCRLHTAFLHWPLSSATTKEVQGPDTT
jgi:hypothetical protein